MIRMIGFDSDNLKTVLGDANNWLTNRQTEFKEQFRYIDIRYSSAPFEPGGGFAAHRVHYSVIVIYDNITNNEEIDKDTIFKVGE